MHDALLESPDGDFPEAPRDMFGPRRILTLKDIERGALPLAENCKHVVVVVTPPPVPPTAKDPPITLADLQRKKPGSRMTTDRPKEMK